MLEPVELDKFLEYENDDNEMLTFRRNKIK